MCKEKGNITTIEGSKIGRESKKQETYLSHSVAQLSWGFLRAYFGELLGKVMHPGNRFNEVGTRQGCVDGCLAEIWSGKIEWAALFVAYDFTVACQLSGVG